MNTPPKRTPLYDLHVELDAKLVPFAGYSMPLNYADGILREHRHCRASAALFDVSHMGQLRVSGPDAAAALESLMPMDIAGLAPNQARYCLLTNDEGGIRDDLMVTRVDGGYHVVVNAACRDADLAYLQERIGARCEITALDDLGLIALQGPAAAAVVERLAGALGAFRFMTMRPMSLGGIECQVWRSGYTGEDGFEISVAADAAADLARRLLSQPEVKPAGLGARDSLRLEAGLCLYGHDIDQTTTPVEAGLVWALSKVRRPDGERAGGYPGAAVVARELKEGPRRRRTGLAVEGKIPVREGAEILRKGGAKVGVVTSGGFSPTLEAPIAMGYVDPGEAADAELFTLNRGREIALRKAALPFVAHRYYRG